MQKLKFVIVILQTISSPFYPCILDNGLAILFLLFLRSNLYGSIVISTTKRPDRRLFTCGYC